MAFVAVAAGSVEVDRFSVMVMADYLDCSLPWTPTRPHHRSCMAKVVRFARQRRISLISLSLASRERIAAAAVVAVAHSRVARSWRSAVEYVHRRLAFSLTSLLSTARRQQPLREQWSTELVMRSEVGAVEEGEVVMAVAEEVGPSI